MSDMTQPHYTGRVSLLTGSWTGIWNGIWNGMVKWKMHCSMYVELPSESLVVPSHCRGFMSKSGIVNRILYSSMQQLAYHWVFGYSSLAKPECHT